MDKTYTITRALVRLKILDAKIKAWNEPVIAVVKGSAKTVVTQKLRGQSAVELEKQFKASLQSVQDLILERDRIKAAIIKSNATTEITIAGEVMTVAQAIEKKSSIQHQKELVEKLRLATATERNMMNVAQNEFEHKSSEALSIMFQKDTTNRADENEIQLIKKSVASTHEPAFLDPNNIQDVIKNMQDRIQSFESEVDVSLSESNAKTEIHLE